MERAIYCLSEGVGRMHRIEDLLVLGTATARFSMLLATDGAAPRPALAEDRAMQCETPRAVDRLPKRRQVSPAYIRQLAARAARELRNEAPRLW